MSQISPFLASLPPSPAGRSASARDSPRYTGLKRAASRLLALAGLAFADLKPHCPVELSLGKGSHMSLSVEYKGAAPDTIFRRYRILVQGHSATSAQPITHVEIAVYDDGRTWAPLQYIQEAIRYRITARWFVEGELAENRDKCAAADTFTAQWARIITREMGR